MAASSIAIGTPPAKRRRRRRDTRSCGDRARWMASWSRSTETCGRANATSSSRPRCRMSSLNEVRRESGCSTDGRPARHEGARALPLFEQAAVDEPRQRLADRDARDRQRLGDVALAGQRFERLQAAALDGALDPLLQAQVERRRRPPPREAAPRERAGIGCHRRHRPARTSPGRLVEPHPRILGHLGSELPNTTPDQSRQPSGVCPRGVAQPHVAEQHGFSALCRCLRRECASFARPARIDERYRIGINSLPNRHG